MSEKDSEIPVVETDQVGVLSSASHSQSVIITVDEETYMVMWDGENLRLFQPAGVNVEEAVVAYKVLGHLAVDLPFPLDFITFERQAQLVIHAYKDGLTDSEEDPEDT